MRLERKLYEREREIEVERDKKDKDKQAGLSRATIEIYSMISYDVPL